MAMIPPPPSKPFVGGSPDKKVAMDVDEEDDFEIIEPSTTARQVKAEVASQKAVPVALAPIELLDDSEDEPDTEDDEEDGDATVAAPAGSGVVVPSPKLNEQTLLEDFARVLKSQGVEGAVPAMVSAVQGMVKTSFSTQKYDQALRGLKQAREEAKKVSRCSPVGCWLDRAVDCIWQPFADPSAIPPHFGARRPARPRSTTPL